MDSKNKKESEQEISPEDLISDLKDILEQTNKEKQEYFNGWQREKADFINYKNKELERINSLLFASIEDFLIKLLPIIDNFTRAEKAIAEDKKQDQNIKGLLMIKTQLCQALKDYGLEPLNRVGEKFDPYFDEIVEIVETDKQEADTIIEELEKGYCFKDKIIRPAKVKIAGLVKAQSS